MLEEDNYNVSFQIMEEENILKSVIERNDPENETVVGQSDDHGDDIMIISSNSKHLVSVQTMLSWFKNSQSVALHSFFF